MRPVEINTFRAPVEGQLALEGWLVYVTRLEDGRALIERLLVHSNGYIYEGLIVPRGDRAIRIGAPLSGLPRDGLYVHAVPVRLTKIGTSWTSYLEGDGEVLAPFEGEAIVLLDNRGRWFIPWLALIHQAWPPILAA